MRLLDLAAGEPDATERGVGLAQIVILLVSSSLPVLLSWSSISSSRSSSSSSGSSSSSSSSNLFDCLFDYVYGWCSFDKLTKSALLRGLRPDLEDAQDLLYYEKLVKR